MQSKDELRESCKLIRSKLNLDGRISVISKEIVKKIMVLKEFASAKNVLLFHPKEGEIDLLELLECEGKNFYLPRCQDTLYSTQCSDMVVCPYSKGDELKLSSYKIFEPTSEPLEDVSVLDIVFVPALCADKYCHRVGYGAGYYDRFFKEHKNLNAKKIIVLPSEMMTEKIDVHVNDMPCDMVISEA